ncbi:MAG: DEAD/DEAH box helicase [Acidobacteriota bacterium]|nr:DEAD/DEAH box helicase [Acidobacteriota bacterium]
MDHTRPRRRRRRGAGAGSAQATATSPQPPQPSAERTSAPHDIAPIEFSALPIHATLRHALEERGFERTTPIQSAVIPFALKGEDVIGCAQTGTGKTAAFVLPILHRLLASDAADGTTAPRGYTRVLILAPTRELAVQIDDEIQGFAYYTGLSSAPIYGGVHMSPQDQALRAGVDIVVATPGRLLDHLRGDGPKFEKIEAFVLDEADRMMDMGFWPDVRRIASALPKTGLQTMLFSATMPEEIMKFAHELAAHAHYVQVGSTGSPAKTITHVAHIVPSAEKVDYLTKFLKKEAHGPILVFARTKIGADRLARRLAQSGIKAAALHADRTQEDRQRAIEGFKSGKYRVVVATDVAARGLDVDGITWVVNFEVPTSLDTYVHRVGRTGRAESTGHALTLVAPEERRALGAIERAFGLELQ